MALSLACGCSSKTNSGDTATGGGTGFNASTGGSANADSGPAGTDVNNICNGLFAGQCNPTQVPDVVKTPNMLIVLDESGSMINSPNPGDPSSKWAEMQTALSGALSGQKIQSNINFGLELFPSTGNVNTPIDPNADTYATSCQLPVGAAAIEVPIDQTQNQLPTILTDISIAQPGGGTPTNMALENAYAYFTQGAGKALTGAKYILLATDGGPNCNQGLTCQYGTCTQNLDLQCGDYSLAGAPAGQPPINCCDGTGYICLDKDATVSEITKLATAGIATYVVGIPGSQAYADTLNAMADAGGVPNPNGGATHYYAVSGSNLAVDLQAAFSSIVTQLITSCDIPLLHSPDNSGAVKVAINCNLVNNIGTADGGTDGFYVDYNYSPAHVELVGPTCANVQVNGATEVDVVTGCKIVQ